MDLLMRHWKDTVTKNVVINAIGNYLGVFIGAIYTVLLFAFFSPYDFGILSILLAISYLLANILSFGIPATLYAHVPTLLPDKQKAFAFLKTNFLFQTFLASLSLAVMLIVLPSFDIYLFKTHLPFVYYVLTALITLLFIWQNFARDALNAAGKFLHINTAITASNIAKALFIMGFGVMGKLTIPLTLIILGVIGSIVMLGMIIAQRRWILQSLIQSTLARSHLKLHFTMSYFVSTQLFNLTTRADLFLIAFFLSPIEAGYYSVAQRVIFIVITSIDSITQVLSPEFAKISTKNDVKKLMKRAFYYVSLPSLLFIIIFITPTAIYRLIIPSAYQQSIPLIKLLSIMYVPFAFDAVLMLFFLYTIKKPLFIVYINTIMLLCVNIFHLLFIPRFGIKGPALSFGITYTVITLIIISAMLREARALKH